MKDTEVVPLGWKLLQSPKTLPIHCSHYRCCCSTLHQCSAKPTRERALLSPQPPLCLSSTVLGICTLADASLGQGQLQFLELGAKAPSSLMAVTLFACAPACAEPARLIEGAPHRRLAGIFASFNSQSSQEPGEGLSAFTETKGRPKGQSQALGAERTQ